MTRKAEVTVRVPGESIAPMRKTCACLEYRLGEEGGECYYQSDKLAGHGYASTALFLAEIVSSLPALRFVFKEQK
jgi:hypothetical protein